jgi:hypothetical protein
MFPEFLNQVIGLVADIIRLRDSAASTSCGFDDDTVGSCTSSVNENKHISNVRSTFYIESIGESIEFGPSLVHKEQ